MRFLGWLWEYFIDESNRVCLITFLGPVGENRKPTRPVKLMVSFMMHCYSHDPSHSAGPSLDMNFPLRKSSH